MIQDLLWRCPLCANNDALRHTQRWLWWEKMDCTVCGARWRVRRAVGDTYYLKIARPGAKRDIYPPGFELPIAGWYDLMKETLRLEALPYPPHLLESGESLYLASKPATLWAETDEKIQPGEDVARRIGTGCLLLTDRRILWRGFRPGSERPEAGPDFEIGPFPLRQVDGIHTFLNLALFLVVGQRVYTFRFAQESPLKWVTYASRLAPKVEAESGHRIRLSHC